MLSFMLSYIWNGNPRNSAIQNTGGGVLQELTLFVRDCKAFGKSEVYFVGKFDNGS